MNTQLRSTTPPRARAGGFSLIEIMIVVVIIGVLAAIAYPAYQNYAREAKRTDAHVILQRIAQQEERYFSDNNTYTADLTDFGYSSAGNVSSPEGHWSVSVTAANATSFTLQAVPAGGHSDPDCATITLNSLGQRGPAGCW